MNFLKSAIIYLITIITLVIGLTEKSYSWSLYKIINDHNENIHGLKSNVTDFNPETDIAFLPPLKNKPLFESIDDLSICRRIDVRKYIYIYLTKGRKYIIKAFERSRLYYDIIEEIFEQNKDVPKDISLLPILESAFNPYAVSRSRAVGMWQFMKATSRSLDLKTDRWTDERRHIEKSTIAAVSHLKSLYKIFNSWDLALAAYNGGASHVKKAMRKTGAKNLIDLQKSGALKRETSEYVPRFIALLVIYKNQGLFDIEDEVDNPKKINTENIVFDYPVDINKVSKISGIPINVLKRYNPELKKNITPPYYKNYALRVPSSAKEKLNKNKAKLYKISYKRLKKHIVKEGECISKIAKLYKTNIRKIIVINGIKNPHLIRPGHKLYIPI